VTTTLSPPIRILGIVGILAAAALGLLLFMQSRSSHTATATPLSTAGKLHSSTSTPALHGTVSRPSTHAATPAAPRIVLLPGLPGPVAHALRYSKVVVVSLYAAGAVGDRAALAQARLGAASAHAGFAAVNVLNERTAVGLDKFAGATSSPAVLVVRRPGRIVNRFQGYADSGLVAQAAQNAGARASRWPALAKPTTSAELFRHELRRDGKIVALLRGVQGEHGAVTVETEVNPVTLRSGAASQHQQFPFTSREQASRFAEAALDALQYLGCTIIE
jgi:hypothetical protein